MGSIPIAQPLMEENMRKKIVLPILILIIVTLACGGAPQENDVPAPSEKIDAKEAIQTYARDVLGLEISGALGMKKE